MGFGLRLSMPDRALLIVLFALSSSFFSLFSVLKAYMMKLLRLRFTFIVAYSIRSFECSDIVSA